jgi:hypothetical protein
LAFSTTVIDSCEEVEKLKSVLGKETQLYSCLMVEDKGSLMPFSNKFGLHQDKIADIADYANKKGLPLKVSAFTWVQVVKMLNNIRKQ